MKLFAFWTYNNGYFDAFLGGEVTNVYENGNVEIKEYGAGSSFKPVKILPLEVGKERYENIKTAESLALNNIEKEKEEGKNSVFYELFQ